MKVLRCKISVIKNNKDSIQNIYIWIVEQQKNSPVMTAISFNIIDKEKPFELLYNWDQLAKIVLTTFRLHMISLSEDLISSAKLLIMNRKIGFSNIGGIYVGENIQTKPHLHQAITIIISFECQFDFSCESETVSCSGVIIQPNTIRQFKSKKNSSTAFIHIEPFLEQGLKLTDRTRPFKTLSQIQIKNIIKFLKIWLSHNKNHEKSTEKLIDSVTSEISTNTITIDQRIEKAIDLIRKVESPTLKSIAATLNLSAFRLSHLFKQETGITFKKFVLYTKLVKSLKAIYENQSLTQSSYSGNFSDQAHFTRTYNNAFGVLPSKTLK